MGRCPARRQVRRALALGFQRRSHAGWSARCRCPSWMRCRASLSSPRVRPASNSANAAASSSSSRAALTRIWLTRPRRQHQERDHKPGERADGDLDDSDRSLESSGLAWFMAGTSSTITAVTVAALRLGLMARDEGQRRHRQHQQRQQVRLRRNAGSAPRWRRHRSRRRRCRACSRGSPSATGRRSSG